MQCVKCGQEIMEGAAFCPCCGEKAAGMMAGEEKPVYTTSVKSGKKSGSLVVYRDRTEFIASSVQKTVYSYSALVSVKKRLGVGTALGLGPDHIDFVTEDGSTESCPVNRKDVHEAFLRIEDVVRPYLAKRQERLLSQGIQYSFASSMGRIGSGIMDILKDRGEFRTRSGQREVVFFKDVREIGLPQQGTLELFLTDGTSRSFAVDEDIRDEVLAFVKNAAAPHIIKRTVGFNVVFGIDEQVEVNEKRGAFHILRQSGREFSAEYPLEALIQCEQTECSESGSVLGGVLSGGMSIVNRAAKAAGVQNAAKEEEKISHVGVILTIRTEQGEQVEEVRFGNFTLRMSRTNEKYDRYLAETSKFMDYLNRCCPECRLVMSELENKSADRKSKTAQAAADFAGGEEKIPMEADALIEKDESGIVKYIEGVSGFISECRPPMVLAIQGSRDNRKESIMKMLSDSLEERFPDSCLWFHTRLLLQSGSEDPLPVLVGKGLIRLLSAAEKGNSKDSAVKIAKGIIELVAGAIAPDSAAGKNLVEGLFKDGSAVSLEEIVRIFPELVKKRMDDENGRLIIFIDDLNRLAPVKAVEVLEALRNFSDCDGCVFVIAIDYAFFLRGVQERSGMDPDEGKALFDEIFQMSFRIPVSGCNIRAYVKDRLARMGILSAEETELESYAALIWHSVGGEPQGMDRLFNSFLLIKNMTDTQLYENRDRRLMLFALLCMETSFRPVYEQLKRRKDQVTPELLSGLCDGTSEVVTDSGLNEKDMAEFAGFARVFCDIIDTDNVEDISWSESGVFAEVLEFSSITSR